MQYKEAVKIFKTEVAPELFAKHVDYWTGQECWANFTDVLCRNGDITQKQFDTWETPFKYGKNL